MSNDEMLLRPEKKTASSFILPAALAVGGAALVYKATKKKEPKSSNSSSAPKAKDNEVVFSANYGSYTMGKDYKDLVLEPYLAEMAEGGNLILREDGSGMMSEIPSMHDALMKGSRDEVIAAFKSTYHVKVGSEKVQISSLPQDKTGVQNFNAWIESEVKNFQENY